jgi:hypothetical protein
VRLGARAKLLGWREGWCGGRGRSQVSSPGAWVPVCFVRMQAAVKSAQRGCVKPVRAGGVHPSVWVAGLSYVRGHGGLFARVGPGPGRMGRRPCLRLEPGTRCGSAATPAIAMQLSKVSTEAPSPRKCTRAIKVWRQCRKRYGPEDPDKTQWVRERSRPRRRGIWDDCSQARHGHSDGRLRLRPDSIPGTDE